MEIKKVTYSTKNIDPLAAALGLLFLAFGSELVRSGFRNTFRGLGFKAVSK